MKLDIAEELIAALKRLPPDRQRAVGKALEKFRKEPKLPSLKFRPLKSAEDTFIINANRGDRIILLQLGDDHYEAADCGPHDNVYRIWNR